MKSIDAAVVTLFNPNHDILDNILSYLPFVNELIVIDNSKTPCDLSYLFNNFPSVTLLSQGRNLGIAKSLNLALSYAKKQNHRWLMTIDQDSYFDLDQLMIYFSSFHETSKEKLAVFSPLHNPKFVKRDNRLFNTNENYVMTSANIINIDIASSISGFDEKLFIDEVDHEFCLRLKKCGYKIVQNHNSFINHMLGDQHSKYKVSSLYSYQRLYYMMRNYLYMRKKYRVDNRDFFAERDLYLFKFMLKQLVYSKYKRKTLGMLYVGIRDYRNEKMGYRVRM